MALDRDEMRRLERRAKSLLLDKEIPPAKMGIVRSLMNNRELRPEERYNAIISLIKSCPNKVIKKTVPSKIDLPAQAVPSAKTEIVPEVKFPGPEESSVFIETLQGKYRKLRLFKKRYLIHANNRFGIGFKKRLIPTKKCIRLFKDIIGFHEEILSHLSEIMIAILKDEKIQDPVDFNYLRLIRKWMLETPLIEYQYDTIKWMDRKSFESELRNFVLPFFAFQKVSIERREQILQTVENMLRTLPDFKKEEAQANEPDNVKRGKDKTNLAREKKIYEYMMLLRSFLPVRLNDEDKISTHLKLRYDITSYPEFLRMIMEVLVFWCEIGIKELERYYEIEAPTVRTNDWDYRLSELRKVGKDPESRKRKAVEQLKEKLRNYDTLLGFLEMKQIGQSLLVRAYEDQWKQGSRRQIDIDEIMGSDFIKFIDGCLNFFYYCYSSLLDGSTVYFEDATKQTLEGSIFSPEYFSVEINDLQRLLSDFHSFKSNNPILAVSREEVRRIMRGQIKSMSHVESIIKEVGSFFYGIGREIQWIYDLHKTWSATGSIAKEPGLLRTSLKERPSLEMERWGRPIPFSDCRITGFEKSRSFSKLLVGKTYIDANDGGIVPLVIAFTYQMAHECMNENIYEDLEDRKRILKELKNLVGKEM